MDYILFKIGSVIKCKVAEDYCFVFYEMVTKWSTDNKNLVIS